MHICYITRNYDNRAMGGRNPSLRYFAPALENRGHRVSIVSAPYTPSLANSRDGKVRYTNYFGRLSYDANLLFAIPRLYRAVLEVHREHSIDVLHALYREFAGVAGVFLKWHLRIPLVQWMYDLGYASQRANLLETGRSRLLSPLLLAYLQQGERFVLDHADRILAIGPDIIERSLHPRGYREPRVVLMNNTVDTDLFSPDVTPAPRPAGVPSGRPLVLMVSRIDPIKGVQEFIYLARRIHSLRPDVHFLVVGNDKDGLLPGYQERARALGLQDNLHWEDKRDDIERVYRMADCVVICTRDTGGGIANVLLEAMASGRVVVANRACGVPYVIEDWVNGVSIPDNSPDIGAQAVVRILDEPELRSSIQVAARRTMLDRFSLEDNVSRLESVYMDVLGTRAGVIEPRVPVP